MDLSLIICTWNNSERLRVTLDAIARCRIPEKITWELVIVNNNCTDNTDAIICEFRHKLPISYVHEPVQGLSQARNTGLKKAAGRLIIFTDDDVKPGAVWISAYWHAFMQRPEGFYFGGPVQSEFEGNKPDNELLAYAPPSVKGLDFGTKERKLETGEKFVSANWACPVDGLNTVGGFDTRFGLDPTFGQARIGEETDLMKRLQKAGYSPWYLPDALIVHFVGQEKSTFAHIAGRNQALGFFIGQQAAQGIKKRPPFYGIPKWMYKEAMLLFYDWTVEKLKGQKGYAKYMQFKYKIGQMQGIRNEILKQNK
jgi:glucosyl-dolichyl phosphate glucuronosyltransferase